VLAPSLLRQPVPVLVGLSNVLVSQCNFAVMYFFPLWFESVQLASASEAGAGSLLPPNVPSFGTASDTVPGWYRVTFVSQCDFYVAGITIRRVSSVLFLLYCRLRSLYLLPMVDG
jgi:hypothetical protein